MSTPPTSLETLRKLRDHEAKYGVLSIEEVLSVPNPQGPWANVIEYFQKPEAWLERKRKHLNVFSRLIRK